MTDNAHAEKKPRVDADRIWCVIPVHNNKDTVRDVALACRTLLPHVLVVDDGSTDADVAALLSGADITVLKHERNFGKGRAILTALSHVQAQGGRFMITLDADGQHRPDDIRKFIPLIEEDDDSIIIGCRDFSSAPNVPPKSVFGRTFSNLWVRMETGSSAGDSQSGFRAYPVHHLSRLSLRGRRFEFEIEVLVKAAWAGVALKTVPISVHYPPEEKRVSSFQPFRDNLRISAMHAMLIGRRLVPWPDRKLVRRPGRFLEFLRHPGRFVASLLAEHGTPAGLAASAAVGVFLATLPLVGLHTAVILYVTTRLNLNRIMALSIQNLCMPPFIPAACIELGYFMRHGYWLTDFSMETLVYQLHHRILEWFLGSLVIGPLAAVLAGFCVYAIADAAQRKRSAKTPDDIDHSRKIMARRRGNRLGFWFFKVSLRVFGLKGAYGLLYIVGAHYLLFDRAAVTAALSYVTRRFPDLGRAGRMAAVYKLFIQQGKNLIDRYGLLTGAVKFDIAFNGYEQIEPLLKNPNQGFVLLMSHVGNWQIIMTALRNLNRTVYLLMRPEDNLAVRDSLAIDQESSRVRIISPEQFMGGVGEMMKQLAQGHVVSIMGDRSYGFSPVDVMFLGAPARFPAGPFAVAASSNCPVVALFSAKTAARAYRIDVGGVFHPQYESGTPKKDQLRQWAQEYADILQCYLQQHPFQCFLFHDVWRETEPLGSQ